MYWIYTIDFTQELDGFKLPDERDKRYMTVEVIATSDGRIVAIPPTYRHDFEGKNIALFLAFLGREYSVTSIDMNYMTNREVPASDSRVDK